MNTKFIVTIGIVAIVLGAIGFMATAKRDQKTTVDDVAQLQKNEKFFPGLAAKIEDVAKIELADAKEKITVEKVNDKWTVAQSDGYAAREESIRNLLTDISSIKKLEPKTSSPTLYSRIGVEEEPKAESEAKVVKLYDKGGAEIASLIVGKDDYASAEEGKGPNKFVRKTGDTQSWLVAGNIRLYVSKPNWVKSDFLDIPAARIKSVEIDHKDGEKVIVEKPDQKGTTYDLKTKPEGRDVKDAAAPSEPSRALSGLRFDDVKKRASLSLSDADSSATATIQTYDGLVFKTALHNDAGKDYLTIDVSADEPAITAENDARKAAYEVAKKAAETAAAQATPAATPAAEGQPAATLAPSPTPVPEPELVDAEKIKKEATELQANLSQWAYVVPAYYRDRLMRKNDYFLKEIKKEGEPASKPTSGNQPQIQGLPEGFDINQLMQSQPGQ